jgi:hypothetical protein
MSDRIEVGLLVKWTPTSDIVRRSVPLHPDHPGIVVSIGPRHVLVDWVGRRHTHSPSRGCSKLNGSR